MKHLKYFITIPILALMACNQPNTSITVSDDFSTESLKANQQSLDHVLTKAAVAKTFKVDEDKIQSRLRKSLYDEKQHTLIYSWPTGKQIKVGDGKHEIEAYHSVSISNVKPMDKATFNDVYSSNKGIQQYIDELPNHPNYNKEVATIEAEQLQQYANSRKIEALPNMASGAYWETPNMSLHVLAKDIAFTITVNTGEDPAQAKQQSVDIVSSILNAK